MKRRDFIARSTLVSVATFFFPLRMLAQSKPSIPVAVVHIPIGRAHIRHGLLNPRLVKSSIIPDWMSITERQLLYANGHSPSANDIEYLALEADGIQFTITRKADALFHQVDSQPCVLIKAASNDLYENGQLSVIHRRLEKSDMSITGDFMIILHGEANCGGLQLTGGDAILLQDKGGMNLYGPGAELLVIRRN